MDKEIDEIKPCEVNVGDKSVTFEIRVNLTMYYGKAHIAIEKGQLKKIHQKNKEHEIKSMKMKKFWKTMMKRSMMSRSFILMK